MKLKFLFVLVLTSSFVVSFGQQYTTWSKWSWLIGDWKGEGSGQPGAGSGMFSFKTDLNENILVRRSHSEYPAANGRPATIHDDLMVVYTDNAGNPSDAIYFDNEKHVIRYSITYSDKTIIFTSEKTPDAPIFRLSYTLLDNGKVNTRFEMSQDGQNFKVYIEGISSKV